MVAFRTLLLCGALVFAALHAVNGSDEGASSSAVVALTKDTFDEFLAAHDTAFIKFFAPWCGHCKQLAPKWEEAAVKAEGRAAFATVDCTQESELCRDRFNIRGYPTLKVARGGYLLPYNGNREVDSLLQKVAQFEQPAVAPLTESVEGTTPVFFVLIDPKSGEATRAMYEAVAKRFQDTVPFYFTKDGDVGNDFDAESFPAIVVVREGKPSVYSDKYAVDELTEWVSAKRFLYVEKLTGETYDSQTTRKPYAAIAAVDPADKKSAESMIAVLRKLAQETDLENHFTFSWLDAKEHAGFIKARGVAAEHIPTVFVISGDRQGGIPLPKAAPQEQDIATFLRDVSAGRLSPDLSWGQRLQEFAKDNMAVVVSVAILLAAAVVAFFILSDDDEDSKKKSDKPSETPSKSKDEKKDD